METDPGNDQPMLVRCEVTNDLVPEDETVMLQGKRVSARGKQILLERLGTGQSLDNELEAPGSLRRFGCAILDGILVGLVGAVVGGALGAAIAAGGGDIDARVIGMFEFFGGLIAFAYFVLMHASRGQTLGKMAGKIKVVNLDGSDISFTTALIRGLMFNGIQLLPSLLVIVLGEAFFGTFEDFAPYDILTAVIGLYVLANAITVLVAKDKRAIHDFIAGTRVIQLDA